MALQASGPSFRVDNSEGIQPSNAALAEGSFVVVWDDNAGDVHVQRVSAAGAEVGPEQTVDSAVDGFQTRADVTGLAGGGYVVTWTERTTSDVRGQVFDASGAPVGSEFVAHAATAGIQDDPTVTALEGGGFVISWAETTDIFNDPDGFDVKAQVFGPTGAKVGPEIEVNTYREDGQGGPVIAGLEGGGFVIVYPSDGDVRGQVFDAAGEPVGQEFRVNDSTAGRHGEPQVAALTDGRFVVVWSQRRDGEDDEVFAQIYNANGQDVGGHIAIQGPVDGRHETDPAVTGLANGGFVVGWVLSKPRSDQSDFPRDTTWLQAYDADGDKSGPAVQADTGQLDDQGSLDLTTLANGDVAATWNANTGGDGPEATQVRTQIFDVTSEPTPAPTIRGTSGDDVLAGGPAADRLNGRAGNDSLLGGNGDDDIDGGSGRDTLVGGEGADTLDGESGNDSLTGGNGDDRLKGAADRDTLLGGEGNDRLEGGSGRDRLEGGLGNDTLWGNSDDDVFVFGGAPAAGERDVIRGFDEDDDRILLTGGATITNVDDSSDVTGDGSRDTVLELSNGGSVVLSGFVDWNSGLLV